MKANQFTCNDPGNASTLSAPKILPLMLVLLLAGGVASRADEATPPPAASTGADVVTTMEKFSVSEVPVENQILPTVRPVDSVLGDDASILDIPRSVSTVNKAWMNDRQVTNAMDFGQFSPGVYSPARYGVPATPQVRGDNAQIYMDGQATLFTAQSFFPSFNGVEAMDIVKGPGSAVFGPQSEAPGGYVNLVTKQPFFDRQHTTIEMTAGYLTSGQSYWNPEFTIDTSGPLSDKFAYRVSYLSRYGDGYYENERNQTQDVFTAFTYKATSRLTLDLWAQWYGSLFVDVTGANRPTQQFIDHGTYIGGQVVAYPDNPPYGIGVVDGSFGVLDPTTAYTTKLPAYKALVAPGDGARTGRFQSQLTSTLDLGSDSRVVNRTYVEDAHEHQYNLFGYSEYMPVQESFQDRVEWHKDFEVSTISNSLIVGADFRFTRIIAYQDYAIEPFFYYDLNQPSSNIVLPGIAQYYGTLGGGYQVPGAPKFSAYLPNDSANQDSHIYDSAIFIQDHIQWSNRFSSVLGLRGDEFNADDGNQDLIRVFDPATGTVYNPGIWIPHGSIFYASGSAADPSYFASLVFKATPTRSFYVTYNRVDSVLGSSNFGGVNVSLITDGANGYIGTPQQYHQQLETALRTASTLYEAGYKESFLGNTLYLSGAIYEQLKSEPQIEGPAFQVKSQGIELESVYQPTKALGVNANFTYQSVTDFGTAFFQQTNSYLDGYPVGFNVDGTSGTGDGSPNFSQVPENNYAGYYSPAGGRMKAPGVPQMLANIFVQYQFPSGFGFGIGPQIQGRQYANDQDTLHISTECEVDGYLFYRAKTWDVQINLKNITNRRLTDPVDVTFAGNDAIYVRPPISAGITFRYHL
jgi:outer membrane receptor for monomeric catechols